MSNANKWLLGLVSLLVVLLGYQTIRENKFVNTDSTDNIGAVTNSINPQDSTGGPVRGSGADSTVFGGTFTNTRVGQTTGIVAPTETTLNIPIFKWGNTTDTAGGEVVGCGDRLVFMNKSVPVTQGVINATYQELFAMYPDVTFAGSQYRNEVGAETDHLRFDHVTLINGVAKVYLEGVIMLSECALPRLEAQLTRTATYFPNVQIVQVFLNGQLVDWKKLGNQKD